MCKTAPWKLQHRAQNYERRTYALHGPWNVRAHGPHRRPQLNTQPNVWLFVTPEQASIVVPETPSPIAKPGRSRGRGHWRAPQMATPAPGVGTRSQTRQREMQDREEEAQVASARWPPSPDLSEDITHLTREMQIRDAPGGAHAALECVYPSGDNQGYQSHWGCQSYLTRDTRGK